MQRAQTAAHLHRLRAGSPRINQTLKKAFTKLIQDYSLLKVLQEILKDQEQVLFTIHQNTQSDTHKQQDAQNLTAPEPQTKPKPLTVNDQATSEVQKENNGGSDPKALPPVPAAAAQSASRRSKRETKALEYCNICYDILNSIASGFPWVVWEYSNSPSESDSNLSFITYFIEQFTATVPDTVRHHLDEFLELVLVPRPLIGTRPEALAQSNELFHMSLIFKFYSALLRQLESSPASQKLFVAKLLLFMVKGAGPDIIVHIDRDGQTTQDPEKISDVLAFIVRSVCEVKNKEQVLQVVSLLIEIASRCEEDQESVLLRPICELVAGIGRGRAKGLLINAFGRLVYILTVRCFWKVVLHLVVTFEAVLRTPRLAFATRPLFMIKDLIDRGITVDQLLEKVVFQRHQPDICKEKVKIESEMLECGLNSQLLEESTLVQPLVRTSSAEDHEDQPKEEESLPVKQLKTN